MAGEWERSALHGSECESFRNKKWGARSETGMLYMVDGPAEPKGVNGRWEMMKEIWLKATEDVLT